MVSPILGHESLFIVEAESDCLMMTLSKDDLFDVGRTNLVLMDTLTMIKSMYFIKGKKYDFNVFDPEQKLKFDMQSSRQSD